MPPTCFEGDFDEMWSDLKRYRCHINSLSMIESVRENPELTDPSLNTIKRLIGYEDYWRYIIEELKKFPKNSDTELAIKFVTILLNNNLICHFRHLREHEPWWCPRLGVVMGLYIHQENSRSTIASPKIMEIRRKECPNDPRWVFNCFPDEQTIGKRRYYDIRINPESLRVFCEYLQNPSKEIVLRNTNPSTRWFLNQIRKFWYNGPDKLLAFSKILNDRLLENESLTLNPDIVELICENAYKRPEMKTDYLEKCCKYDLEQEKGNARLSVATWKKLSPSD